MVGPGLGFDCLRWFSKESSLTGDPTVARGLLQLLLIESATAILIDEAGLVFLVSRSYIKDSKSSTVIRPPAPLPAMPARSAALSPRSSMRALNRGEIYRAPVAFAGTGRPSIVGVTLGFARSLFSAFLLVKFSDFCSLKSSGSSIDLLFCTYSSLASM